MKSKDFPIKTFNFKRHKAWSAKSWVGLSFCFVSRLNGFNFTGSSCKLHRDFGYNTHVSPFVDSGDLFEVMRNSISYTYCFFTQKMFVKNKYIGGEQWSDMSRDNTGSGGRQIYCRDYTVRPIKDRIKYCIFVMIDIISRLSTTEQQLFCLLPTQH